jgi:hypothetical protein
MVARVWEIGERPRSITVWRIRRTSIEGRPACGASAAEGNPWLRAHKHTWLAVTSSVK